MLYHSCLPQISMRFGCTTTQLRDSCAIYRIIQREFNMCHED